jgi:hypothetical protein
LADDNGGGCNGRPFSHEVDMPDEAYSVDTVAGAKAFSGTGFNPDNPQHMIGSDAVRYAIRLQQKRDAKDYAAADEFRAMVESVGYFVMQEPGATRVKAKPLEWHQMSLARRKAFKAESHMMPVLDGIIYDA